MSWFKVGAALGGALLGGLLNKSSAKSQAQQNADLSRENWIYQQSNAHQLEVQDLKNAGLNPILSATNSQMAGMSPVSGQSSGQGELLNSAIANIMDIQAKKEMQKADLDIEGQKLKNELVRTQIQRDEADAQIAKWKSEGKLLDVQADYTSAKKGWELNESNARVEHIKSDIANASARLAGELELMKKQGASYDAMASKAYAEIGKIAEETLGVKLSNRELRETLDDPFRLLERLEKERGVKDENMLGKLHSIGMALKEVSSFIPSRIGIGYSKR